MARLKLSATTDSVFTNRESCYGQLLLAGQWSEVCEIPQGQGFFQGDDVQFSAKYRQKVERPWVEQMCKQARV